MSANSGFEHEWTNWIQLQRKIVSLLDQNAVAEALSALDGFLSRESNPELRSDALGWKADVHERIGDLATAMTELLEARSLVGPAYVKYVHELRIAGICCKQQKFEDALRWYREALDTSAKGNGISGGNALNGLLNLQGKVSLSDADFALCSLVAKKSWNLLGLPGEPNLGHLPDVVSKIRLSESDPPRKQPEG